MSVDGCGISNEVACEWGWVEWVGSGTSVGLAPQWGRGAGIYISGEVTCQRVWAWWHIGWGAEMSVKGMA